MGKAAGSVDRMPGPEWKLYLRTGFGNVFSLGRWKHEGSVLIANAVNSGSKKDWRLVEDYANDVAWVPEFAN